MPAVLCELVCLWHRGTEAGLTRTAVEETGAGRDGAEVRQTQLSELEGTGGHSWGPGTEAGPPSVPSGAPGHFRFQGELGHEEYSETSIWGIFITS